MNNKGFMMAEVVVVAAVILVAFSFFYINYNSLISLNNERIAYYDVATLYELANYAKTNKDEIKTFILEDGLDTIGYSQRLNKDGKIIYLLDKNIFLSDDKYTKLNVKNKTFKNYLKYLSQSKELGGEQYILVMEKCQAVATGDFSMDCKYAYLETAV